MAIDKLRLDSVKESLGLGTSADIASLETRVAALEVYEAGGLTAVLDSSNDANNRTMIDVGGIAIGKSSIEAGYQLDVAGSIQSTGATIDLDSVGSGLIRARGTAAGVQLFAPTTDPYTVYDAAFLTGFDSGNTVQGARIVVQNSGLALETTTQNSIFFRRNTGQAVLPTGTAMIVQGTTGKVVLGDNVAPQVDIRLRVNNGSIQCSAVQSFSAAVSTIVLDGGNTVYCNSSAGAITLNLPSATAAAVGITYHISKNGANNVVITRAGADTIGGAATYTLNQNPNDGCVICCVAAGLWQVVGRFAP